MSVTPRLNGMPAPANEAGEGAEVVRIEETGAGAKVTMSDGREILVKPGDEWHISPITRDTQVVTQGNPEPRSFRDLHNSGGLPDIIQSMLEATPQTQAPSPGPSLAGGSPAGPLPGMPPGGMGDVPMLPDMMGIPLGVTALNGTRQGNAQGAVPGGPPGPGLSTPPGGLTPAPGTPPPDSRGGPLGMPPGAPPSPAGPPGRFPMPPMPPDVPMLPGMPPPQAMRRR